MSASGGLSDDDQRSVGFSHRNHLTQKIKEENPIASRCYAFREDAMHFFVKDKEHPMSRKTIRLDPRLSGWRQISNMGKAGSALE